MARWEQQCFPNSIILTCIIGKVLFFISGTWVWWQMIDKIVGGVGGCSPLRHTTRMRLSWANFLSFNSCRDSDYRPFIRWPEKLIASVWNLCISDSRLSCKIISCFLFIFREAEILERRNQGRKGRSSQKYLFILLNSAHKGGGDWRFVGKRISHGNGTPFLWFSIYLAEAISRPKGFDMEFS